MYDLFPDQSEENEYGSEEELEEDGSDDGSEAQSEEESEGVSDCGGGDEMTIVQPKAGTFIGEPVSQTKLARRIKSKINRLLKSAETSGDFISHFVSDNLINPGLEIDGHGFLGLPISQQSVRALSQHLHTTHPSCTQHGCLLCLKIDSNSSTLPGLPPSLKYGRS